MSILLSFSLIYIIYRIFTCKEGKIFAIKEILAEYYLKFTKRKEKSRLDNYDHFSTTDIKRVNILIPDEEQELEYRQKDYSNKCEGLFVFGFNSQGERLSARISAKNNDANVWIHLKTQDGRIYELPRKELRKAPRTDASCFSAAGLRFRCLMPFRKWRISFNGMLRELASETHNQREIQDVHVKFSFLWIASSAPLDNQDIPITTLAKYLAGQKWKGWLPKKDIIPKGKNSIDQAGNFMGTVSINGEPESEILLWGARERFYESVDDQNSKALSSEEYFSYMSEGEYVHIIDEKHQNNNKRFVYGHIVYSNSMEDPLDKILSVDSIEERKFLFTKGKNDFELVIPKLKEKIDLKCEENFEKLANIEISTAKLNEDEQGHSMHLENCLNTATNSKRGSFGKSFCSLNDKLILKFSDHDCQNVENTGGKGSSLAQLMQFSKCQTGFTVPNGFVITAAAYDTFLEYNGIQKKLKDIGLQDVAWNVNNNKLKDVCHMAVTELSEMELPKALLTKLEENLKEYDESSLFAVRSSASGEDSEEMSAAGQMETFLGIQGKEAIAKAVVKCWASQFSLTAIQYKKQNGQVLNSPMAVVVQEMIPSEKAGVMFTCNPVTGNPQFITITANYGLGESVVSATAEPDTVVVKRDLDGNLAIESEQIGRKTKMTAISEMGGVSERDVSESETIVCCLTKQESLGLAKLGHQLEEEFGCPLDIEWGIAFGKLFLLQSRPVTTFDRETDFEIIHETDVHLRCEKECMSKANVGEVMPGAMSELGVNFLFKLLELSMQNHFTRKDQKTFPVNPFLQKNLILSSKHVLFNVTDMLFRFQSSDGEMNAFTKSYIISFFGRLIHDDDLKDRAVRRNKFYPTSNTKKNIFHLTKAVLTLKKRLAHSAKFIHQYQMNIDRSLPAEAFFHELLMKIFDTSTHTACHGETSFTSSIYGLVLLSTLSKANKNEWNEKVFSDFATLLSSCKDVESADVPFALQKLAVSIGNCIDAETFRNMPFEDALNWLKTSGTKASEDFELFLNKHGHRCVKEFDILSEPWRINPKPLVKNLQEMVLRTKKEEKQQADLKDIINSLKIPLNWKTRLLLRIVVPFCQTAVGRREMSKSVMIKTVDHFRQEFKVLADKMVTEGRLPDSSLLYFLTLYEVDQLLKTRSPKLIQKATRRKKLHPVVDSYRFPEIFKGIARPVNASDSIAKFEEVEGGLIMRGTPVSQGVVKARVRVANNLDEASEIQPGEILIAYSTDIGWSPYFPVLSGVVTELGGLISHGAVVAREYGLPCVVGLHGATSVFKTGDIAILDANKGTLQKVTE